MAEVVTRTLSSSSTTRTRDFCAARWPLVEMKLSGFLSGIRFRERRRIHGENDVEGRALPFGARHLDATAGVAREPEHLTDDVRDALGLAARNVEEASVLLKLLARREKVERVLDGFERVVDLVRDGGRKPSDSRELLRLEELLLDASALKL